ncbi:MAG: MaoC family dehydratase [Deltaproteobacteria bacterium]|jgi:3-hydroxybutyryl-CoA dehydratase|nr:MaoC family dehydratase [Deltaproteobacteria bacterium]
MPAYADIKVGDAAEKGMLVTDELVRNFAALSGDFNPVHLDQNYASATVFGHRVAHGVISAALISTVLGTCLPGEGTIYLSQTLNFRKPVFIDEHITAKVEVMDKNNRSKKIRLVTTVYKADGQIALSGEAWVMCTR